MGSSSGVATSYDVGGRCGSNLMWLWCTLAAVALSAPPSLGTSICHRYSHKKEEEKEEEEKKKKKKVNEKMGALFREKKEGSPITCYSMDNL